MECPSILRVSTVAMKIDKNEDGSLKFSGVQGRFLGTVLEAMKMPYKLVTAEDGEWGRLLPDGNWTGMIGMVHNDVADIAESFITITEKRATVVDFSPVYWIDDLTFAIKKPNQVLPSLAFALPFDYTTWLLILIFLLTLPLLFQHIFRSKETHIYILLRLLGSVFRQSTLSKYDNKFFRPLIFSWWFSAIILSLSYSAVLLSMLSIPSEIIAVKNFKELANAVKDSGYRIHVTKGAYTLELLLNSDKEHLRYLGENALRNSWYLNPGPLTLSNEIDYSSAIILPTCRLELVAGPEEWKPHFLSDDSLQRIMLAVPEHEKFSFCFNCDRFLLSSPHKIWNFL